MNRVFGSFLFSVKERSGVQVSDLPCLLSRPVVSGVCKFQHHLLRILPALCLRRGLGLHAGGPSALLSPL